MAKRIEVTVRRADSGARPMYEVTTHRRPGLTGAQEGSARNDDPDEVISAVGQLLTSIFSEGDTIEFCNVDYRTVDEALHGVRAARVDWE